MIIMIQESYISFEQAKALNELGCNCETSLYYGLCDDLSNIDDWKEVPLEDSYDFSVKDNCKEYYPCPTLSLVQKWLREEKNTIVVITWEEFREQEWSCEVICYPVHRNIWVINDYDITCCFKTYEQALSAGIDKCIELLKR